MQGKKPFGCFDRRYFWRLAPALVVVLAAGIGAKAFPLGAPQRLALVALECAALGFVIVVTIRSIGRLDELNQRIHFEAIVASFTVTAVLGTALGLLERAGLRVAGWELWLWSGMALLWGLGVLVVQRRYR